MSLDDDAGGFDPQSLIQDQMRQQAPDLTSGSVDPQSVIQRLIRKTLGNQRPDDETRLAQPTTDHNFSSFGKIPSQDGAAEPVDFTQFGAIPDQQPKEETGGALSVGARAAGQSAVKSTGGALEGLGLLTAAGTPASVDVPYVPGLSEEMAQTSQSHEAVQANPLYQAGKATQQWADKNIPVSDAERQAHPIAATVGGAVGGVVGPLALGAIDPVAGIAGGAALFGLSGEADTYDAAIAKGADEQTARQAASLSGAANAALGALPIGNVLKPFANIAPQASGWAMRALARAAENGVTFATVGEAQEYLGQQIAKEYDPKAGYQFDGNRLIGELLAGAALGAGHSMFEGHGQAAENVTPGVKPDEQATPDQQNPGLPPGADTSANTGEPGPQPQPGTGGAGAQGEPRAKPSFSMPKGAPDHDDAYDPNYRWGTDFQDASGGASGAFYRDGPHGGRWYYDPSKGGWEFERQADWTQWQGAGAQQGSGGGPSGATQNGPQGQNNAPPPPPFETKLDLRRRAKLEEKAAYYKEFTQQDIASWDDDKLKEYVRAKVAGFGSAPSGEEAPQAGAPGPQTPEETLRRYGYEDHTINEMPAAARKATADQVRQAYPNGPPKPVDINTPQDLRRAEAPLANGVQSRATWNGLNLTVEVPAGGKRTGYVKGTGEEWTSTHPHTYGRFDGLPNAADGMAPDFIMGDHPSAPTVFLIDELDKRKGKVGQYKQTKALIGFQSPQDAIKSYLGISTKTREQIGGVAAMSRADFVQWAKGGGFSKPATDLPEATAAEAPQSAAEEPPKTPREPSRKDHAAIEDAIRAVGGAPEAVRPAVIAEAAEIHAQEGLSPADAYQLAVVRGNVRDGVLTREQVKEQFGEHILSLLEPAGAPERGVRAATPGAAAGGPAAENANERVRDRGENGAPAKAQSAENAGAETGAEHGAPERGEAAPAGGGQERENTVRESASGKRNAESNERGAERNAAAGAQPEHAAASKAPLIGDRVASLKEHKVTAADGTSIEVAPVVVEASKLITSADLGYDKSLQPRQRERAASQAQIREIATRLEPERLGYSAEADRGAPIVGPDRMVESGNGRVHAIRAVYLHNKANAEKYRDWLKAQGVDVAKYKEPILVRQRISDLDQEERKAFTVSANQAATLSMSAPERALADADHITPSMLDLLADADLNNLENRKFVRAFVGSLPASERGALSSKEGGLSTEGLARVRNAVLAKAYGDPDIVARVTESTDDEVKALSNALVSAAPAWAKMRADMEAGTVSKHLDMTKNLVEAVKRTADMRSKGMKLADYLAQQDAFDHIEENVDGFLRSFYDPEGKRAKSAKHIAEFIRFCANEAAKVSADAGLDLGLPEVTVHDIQRAAAEKTSPPAEHRVREGSPEAGAAKPRPAAGKGRPRPGAKKFRTRFAEPGDLFGDEPGAEGKPQLVIPGAERRSAAELAKRRAAEPLKAKVEQKPPGGLFAGPDRQADLFAQPPAAKPAAEKKPAAPPSEKSEPSSQWTEIGKNRDGDPLYEDAKGVRSFVDEDGVRVTEHVSIVPTRRGVKTKAAPEHHGYFKLESELTEGEKEQRDLAKRQMAEMDRRLREEGEEWGGVSDDTLEHYAKALDIEGIPTAEDELNLTPAERKHLITELTSLGAKPHQSGAIIAIPKSKARMIEALRNTGYGDKGVYAPDELFDQFKRALAAHPDKIKPSIYDTEPNGDSVTWTVKVAKGGEMNFGAYADTVMITGGSFGMDMSNIHDMTGGVGSTYPKRSAELFMKTFIKENPVKEGAAPQTPQAEEPKGQGTLVNRIRTFLDPKNRDWDMSQWHQLIKKAGDANALDALGRIEPKGYDEASTLESLAKTLQEKAVQDGRRAAGDIKGKGKDKDAQRQAAAAKFDGVKAKAEALIEKARAVRAKEIEAALKDAGIENGQPVKYKEPVYDGRTGARMPETYGHANVQPGATSLQIITAPRGDWLHVGPDEIRELEKVDEKDIARASHEPAWQWTYGGEEDVDSQYLADLLNGVASGDYKLKVQDYGQDGTGITVDGSIVAISHGIGDLKEPEIIRSFLEAAQKEAGLDQGDVVHIEQAIDERAAKDKAEYEQAKQDYEDWRDSVVDGLRAVRDGKPIDDETRELLADGDEDDKQLIKGEGDKVKLTAHGARWLEEATKVNVTDQSLTPPAEAPTSKEGASNGGPPASGTDLFGGPLRQAAPAVPGEHGAARGRAPRAPRPDQLSLFDRPGSGKPSHDAHDAAAGEPATSKPPVPGEGEGPAGPPPRGGRSRAPSNRKPTPAAASRGLKEARQKIAERARLNYRITDEDHIGEGTAKQKVAGNLEAIRTLKAIEDEARQATPEEQAKLVKYVGWGAFAQDMFADHKANWEKERAPLRSLLDDSEYDAARASTLNAHFTSPEVISGLWQALDHLGFDGGLALEPSAGVGHFIGLIPDKVAPKTAWTATELDPITGRIAKLLYPGADIGVHGFEELNRPSNYFDLAVSNVPFGDYNITEKPYGSHSIHDFFFVKSLDKVRPGGVVAFITSRYTMDKKDDSVRRLLAKTSDLVGAIRLPGGRKGAFAGNAGTEVTTDIIFLRKKVQGEPPLTGRDGQPIDWLDTKEIETPDGPATINEYFANHAHMMLGEMRLAGTMYRKDEAVLSPRDGEDPATLGQRIAVAASNTMQPNVFMPREGPPIAPETIDAYDIEGPVKDGAFFVKGGKIFQRKAGEGIEQKFSADDAERVKRLAGMRDTVNDLLATQLAGGDNAKAQAEHLRGKLRQAYDAFVKKYGPINKEVRTETGRLNKAGEPIVLTRYPNIAKFRGDPDWTKVSAIEHYDPETDKAKPADIQTKDVIEPPRARQIDGPGDALAASLNDLGRVDLSHVAESLGLDSDEAAAQALGDLVYLDPNGRMWKTSDDYLSGDVVKKLEEARAIAAQDATYQRNVDALEKVQPQPLTRADIVAQFGAPWVPPDVYTKFLEDEFGAQHADVERVPITGEWRISHNGFSSAAAAKYGTDRVRADKIFKAAINGKTITVYDDGPNDTRVINTAATEQARIKADLLKERFSGDPDLGTSGWAFEDEEQAQRLEAIYNRTYNNLVPRKFNGSHLTFPGLNPDFSDRQHRKDAVWRMVQTGNTLLDHEVGSGKTATMIAGGMEMKRLGLINKPAYVVPNHMLEQFSREFIQAYPNAKILVASKEEMTPDARKGFLAKAAANDWDGVIITHDAFGRVNISLQLRKQFVKDQMDELERVIRAEADASGKNSETVKGLEKSKQRLKDKLHKLMNEERKDDGTSFEESGIDHLFIDEAHLFKNLSFITRMTRVKGLSQGDAQRAEDLFLKIRYLEEKRPGRSAVFATGTPISNTMAEMWTMMRYLMLDKLRERQLDNFDDWASTFGKVVTNMELSADGRTMKEVSSFSKFVNVPELISLWSEVADTKTADMLNLPRPDVVTPSGAPGISIVEAEPSPQEEQYIQSLVKLAEEIKGKPPVKGQPNMLSVVTLGRKVATDGRLISPDFDFSPTGKAAHLVDNVHRIWQDGKEPALAQMIFLDLGVPGGKRAAKAVAADDEEAPEPVARLNLYQDIKDRLVARGIPPEQIAFIHDADTDAKKAKLFQRVRAGLVRVIFGSTGKMGVGTNAQTRLIAMHHMDAPWKPAEVKQRDGRIQRQGNLNPFVQIYRYVTRRSFDAFMWQKLDTKSKFIAQVLFGARGSRTAEDIDSPLPEAAEMKAAASGDPRILEHAELDRVVRQLTAQRRAFEDTKARTSWQLRDAKQTIARNEAHLPAAQADGAKVQDLSGDKFKAEIGDKEYTDRKEAGEAIIKQITAIDPRRLYSETTVRVGTMSSFDMNASLLAHWDDGKPITYAKFSLRGENGYASRTDAVINEQADPLSVARRFERILPGIADEQQRIERVLKDERANVAKLEKIAAETWPKEKEFEQAREKLKALTEALMAQTKSSTGMPSSPANAGETGGASSTSPIEAPPGTQEPSFQASTTPEPSGSSTSRNAPPSILAVPSTLRFGEFSLGDIDPSSKKYILQGSNNIKDLHQAAIENQPKLEARLREIARVLPGVEFLGSRVKDMPGLLDKVMAKSRAPNTISDYLGARVSVSTPAALHVLLGRLHASGGVIEAEDFIGSGKHGYRAYHAQVGLGDGTSAELQIVPKPIADVMEEAHEVRQPVKRILDQSSATPAEMARAKAVMAQAQAIQDNAWDQSPDWRDYQPTAFAERNRFDQPSGPYEASFERQPGVPLGKQAQDWVLERGRYNGDEHAILIAQNGRVLSSRGTPRAVAIAEAAESLVRDPAQSLVLHHNHPTDSTLSDVDIALLGRLGIHSAWAHGHEGRVSRAALTDFGRSLMHTNPDDSDRNVAAFGRIHRGMQDGHFFERIKGLVQAGILDNRRAGDLLAYLVNETMRRAGLIHYQTNYRFEKEINDFGLEPDLDAATADLIRRIPNGAGTPTPGLDRLAGPLRHPGEVGTVFEGSPSPAGERNRPARADQPRRANNRGEAPGQLSLFAEGGGRTEFSDTRQRFGPENRVRSAVTQLRNRVADALGSETAIKLTEGFSDYSHRMRLLQNDVEALHHEWISPDGKLPDEQQFYTLKRLFPGKRSNRVDVFNRQHFDPLVKFLRGNAITEQEAGDYLYAKHAIERNQTLGRYYAQTAFKPEHPFIRAMREPDVVGASGMSATQAHEIIRKAENGPKADAFRELAQRAAGIRRFAQDEMLRGGLVNNETLAEWSRQYQNYVPLKEWDDPEERPDNVVEGNGRGRGDIRGPENRQAFGRRTKADNPLAHLITQVYRTIDRAERNRVLNALANALGTLSHAKAPIADELGIHLNRGRPQKQVDPNTGLVRTVDSAMDRFGENAVQFKRGGEPRFIVFDDPKMAEAVRRWSPAALPGPLHALLWLMNKMKSAWTHYSPNFLVRHNARYFVESTLNALELKETGQHSALAHARQAIPVVGSATRAILAAQNGERPQDHPGEVGDLMRSYALMRQHGGEMVMRAMRDIDQIKEDLRVRLNKLGRAKTNPIETVQDAVEWMNKISSAWDNAQRLATFHSALQQGKTPQQAALLARDATIDYQFRGLWSNIMGLWEPFFNTALRTGFRLGGALPRSKIMRRVFLGTMAMGLAASVWNYFVAGKDKDGVPFFDKIPDYEKAKSLIFLVPWLPDSKGRPSALKFPFPYNWAAPLSFGYGMGNMMWGSQSVPHVLKEMILKPFVSTFSQIGEEGLGFRSLVPELIRPEYDIATNTDWTGRPIHIEQDRQKAPNAYSGKGDYGGRVRTGAGWKDVAEMLNDFSGGSRNRSGLFDFYPEDIREVLAPFIGTQIGLGNEIKETATSIMKGEAPKPTNVPLSRIFFGQDYDAADRFAQFQRHQAATRPWTR